MAVPPGHYPRHFDLTGDFLRQNFVPLGRAAQLPPAPSGVTAESGDGQVLLSWDSVSIASSYAVKRATAPGGPYVVVAARVLSVVFRDTSVSNFTTYYYVVTAVNSAGESPNSIEVNATPGGIPAAPSNFIAAPYTYPSQEVGGAYLSWDPSFGADSYNLYRMVSPVPGTWSFRTMVSGTTAYLDMTTEHEVLTYRLTAVNSFGESAFSNTSSINAYGYMTSAPVLSAVPNGNFADLTWTRPPGLPTNVGVSHTAGTQGGFYVTSWKTSASYAMFSGTNLFTVVAANPVGDSPWSNTVSVVYAPGSGSISIYPTGIPTSQAFGSPNVSVTGGTLYVYGTGVPTSQAFGSPNVSVTGGTLYVYGTGVPTSQAFGSPTVSVVSTPGSAPLYEDYLLANYTQDLRGYYPLASNGSDYSGNGHTGVLVGTSPTFGREGIPGSALKSAYMNAGGYRAETRPASPVHFGGSIYTLVGWAKRDGLGTVVNSGNLGYSNFELIMAKGMAESETDTLNANYMFGVREFNSTVRLAMDFEEDVGGSGPVGLNHPITGDVVVASNNWTMYAATYDGTRYALYTDGALNGAADGVINPNQPPDSNSVAPFCVGGAMRSDQDTWYGRWNGSMAHAAIWCNRVLGSNDVQALYRVGKGLLAPTAELISGSGQQPQFSFVIQVYPGTQINGTLDTLVDDSSSSRVTVLRDASLLTPGVHYTHTFAGSNDRITLYSSGSTFAIGNYEIVVSGFRNTTQNYLMRPGTLTFAVSGSTTPPVTMATTFGSLFVNSVEYGAARGYWPLGQTSGTQVADRSVVRNVPGFSGAWSGAPLTDGQWAVTPTFSTTTDCIRPDNTWTFGVGNYGTDPSNIAKRYREKDFTVMCWFKRNTGPAGATVSTGTGGVAASFPIVTKGMAQAEDPSLNINYFMGLTATNQLVCDFEQYDAGTNRPIWSTQTAPIDQWNHGAMTFDGAQFKLYLNGTLQGVQNPTALPDWTAQARLTIGAAVTAYNVAGTNTPDVPQGWFPGNIAHVVVMSRPADEHFIRRCYEAGYGIDSNYVSGTLVSPTRFPTQGSTFVVRFVGSGAQVDDATVTSGDFQLQYRSYSTGSAMVNAGSWAYTSLGSGTHYQFSYDNSSNQATFTVLPGWSSAWPQGDYRLVIN